MEKSGGSGKATMNYIVLVKQVPDTKHIPQDAWDWNTGTLRRAFLENVCNELDKQALAFAAELRLRRPGRIVALTMGPPFAEEVLRYALAVGADSGVLLTDRRLGGADTPATAYPLARAIMKIERELFEGDRDYLIVAGMQSVDGDTAQVPPQVAQELDIAHVAYVTDHALDVNGEVTVRRLTRNGNETLALSRYPCLVTLTARTPPPYPGFRRTRWAASQALFEWDAEAIGADQSRIGLAGSRTNVVKIFPAKETTSRRCLILQDLEELVGLLRESYAIRRDKPATTDRDPDYRLPEGKAAEYRGDLWIYAEQEEGQLHPAAFELLGKARELALPLGEKVGAVLAGLNVENLASELIRQGADKVFVVAGQQMNRFLVRPYTVAVTRLVEKYKPQILLFSATPMGRELAPRIAYATQSGLTADSTDLRLTDLKRGRNERVGILMQTRPALGGNIMASIVSQNSSVQMSTARPGVLKALEPDNSRAGEIIRFDPMLNGTDPGVRVCSVEKKPPSSGLAEASVVVAGGIGCRTRENFERYVGSLAAELKRVLGAPVERAGSREAVEAGFTDRSRQVGQTGETIAPKLYVAMGISGAVQHLSGVQGAETILAIDKDPKAPIFRACDFGVVGEMETVVPELVRLLEASRIPQAVEH